MIIDRDTFTELAVHLKLASDAMLKTTGYLKELPVSQDYESETSWEGILTGMLTINSEIAMIEKILRALMEANRMESGNVPKAQ